MNPSALALELERLNISLEIADGKLRYHAPTPIPRDVLEGMREHKNALLESLNRRDARAGKNLAFATISNFWVDLECAADVVLEALRSKQLGFFQLRYRDADGWHTIPETGKVWRIGARADLLEAARFARTRCVHPSSVEVWGIRKDSRLEAVATFPPRDA